MASASFFRYRVLVGMTRVPLHARSLSVAQRILGRACARIELAPPESIPEDDDREFFVAAWCMDPSFVPEEEIIFIPEPVGHIPGDALYLQADEEMTDGVPVRCVSASWNSKTGTPHHHRPPTTTMMGVGGATTVVPPMMTTTTVATPAWMREDKVPGGLGRSAARRAMIPRRVWGAAAASPSCLAGLYWWAPSPAPLVDGYRLRRCTRGGCAAAAGAAAERRGGAAGGCRHAGEHCRY